MLKPIARRTIYDQFMTALVEGHCPEQIAANLEVPVATIQLWKSRLRDLAPAFTSDATPGTVSAPATSGLTLIYSPNVLEACAGQMVTFTADVMNDDVDTLVAITLLPGHPADEPAPDGSTDVIHAPVSSPLDLGGLPPGDIRSTTFTYTVTEHDVRRGGYLVSTLAARAGTDTSDRDLTDQGQARVKLISGETLPRA